MHHSTTPRRALLVASLLILASAVAASGGEPEPTSQHLGWLRRHLGFPSCTIESTSMVVSVSPRTGEYQVTSGHPHETFAPTSRHRPPLRDVAVAPDRIDLWFATPDALHCTLALIEGGTTLERRCDVPHATQPSVLAASFLLPATAPNALLLPVGDGRRLDAAATGRWTFGVNRGPGGLVMPMIAARQNGTAWVLSFGDLDAEVVVHRAPRHDFTALYRTRGATYLSVCPATTDDAAARCAALARARRAPSPSWTERLSDRPNLARLPGALLTKVFLEHGFAADAVNNHDGHEVHAVTRTFGEVVELVRHLHDDLGIDRNLLELAGWGRGGYDFAHPDVWPPDDAIDGAAGLARAVRAGEQAGWLVALHDNYDMAVKRSRTFDPADAIGEANLWAGGPHWQIHPERQWKYAERNLDAVDRAVQPNAYFLDATTALPLPEAPSHAVPVTRASAVAAYRDLAQQVAARTGPVGSEDGQEWALGAFDWFEGMLSDGRFEAPGEPFPLFEIAHHGDVALFWHQSETLGLPGARGDWAKSRGSGDDVLTLLSFARTPLFTPPPGPGWWWNEPLGANVRTAEAAIENPFLRGDGGWGEGRHPLDILIKNTYEILSPLDTLAFSLRMLSYQKDEHGVVRTLFGDGVHPTADVEVLVNRGAQPLSVPEGELAAHAGFVARAPTFVAFLATRWNGVDYGPAGALFTMRSLDGAPLAEAHKIRVWHGFGPAQIRIRAGDDSPPIGVPGGERVVVQ